MRWPNDVEFLRGVLDAMPSPLFVVDDDVRILAYNTAAAPLLDSVPVLTINKRGGEAMHCIHSMEAFGGCGASEACKTCVVRVAVTETCARSTVVRRPQRMQLVGASGAREMYILVTTSPLPRAEGPRAEGPRAALMLEDIGDLVTAEGLIPVCMHCRKVRDNGNTWSHMESYLKEHLDLDITHGLCPDCLKAHYPDIAGEG